MHRKLLFIVNPNAGKKMSDTIMGIIRKEIPAHVYYQLVVWKDKDHFDEITGILRSQDYTDAVAVGGDGTVNRVAAAIVNTGIRLAIIPVGSGNGLARSLGLSMQVEQVIGQILQARTARIDTGTVNGIPFFCTSGLGFDAHIGGLFAASVKRGLRSYINITMRELLRYRAKEYTLQINGKTFTRKAFLITVANAGQYGNDFYIAPQASMQDGMFHVVIIRPFNVLKVWGLLRRILGRQAFLSKSVETFTASELVISREEEGSIHFDGEPLITGRNVEFRNYPGSLLVITGESFKAA